MGRVVVHGGGRGLRHDVFVDISFYSGGGGGPNVVEQKFYDYVKEVPACGELPCCTFRMGDNVVEENSVYTRKFLRTAAPVLQQECLLTLCRAPPDYVI